MIDKASDDRIGPTASPISPSANNITTGGLLPNSISRNRNSKREANENTSDGNDDSGAGGGERMSMDGRHDEGDEGGVFITPSPTWMVTKYVILKTLGLVYFVAFLGAWHQNDGLMGRYGLVPAYHFLDKIGTDRYGSAKTAWHGFVEYPSLHWLWWQQTHQLGSSSEQHSGWDNINRHDENMRSIILCGLTCSGWLILGGEKFGFWGATAISFPEADSMLLLAVLWILYFTIVTTSGGTSFYSYGWESQLLETGFLSIFLCQNLLPRLPLPRRQQQPSSRPQQQQQQQQHDQQHPSQSPCSDIVLWLFRWLCFRISLGAGLIKMRGDSCWTQKTCLLYHFETQPIPSPLSFVFHFLPSWMLKSAVDLDLWVQVYTSWMVLLPTTTTFLFAAATPTAAHATTGMFEKTANWLLLNVVRLGGFIQIGFMVNIILSGNFAFLNHLTIIPAIACLDDACWPRSLSIRVTPDGTNSRPNSSNSSNNLNCDRQSQPWSLRWRRWKRRPRLWLDLCLLLLILNLSRPVVQNLLQLDGKRQQMNASFDSFRLVGTYGAFGSVGKQRYEPIISIAYDSPGAIPTTTTAAASDNRTAAVKERGLEWIELDFPCKPGSVHRRPCFCAPYHYRLDWNIWFIGFKPHTAYLNRRETWLYDLLTKMMTLDEEQEEGPNGGTQRPLPRPWLDLLDSSSAGLLQTNYAQHGRAPKYAKVDMYHYEMDAPLWKIGLGYLHHRLFGHHGHLKDGKIVWWRRKFEENLIPIVSLRQDDQRLVRAAIP